MGDIIFPYARKCKKCGKEIFPNPAWVYKKGKDYYCSWKCFRSQENPKPKKEIIIPQIGDTIKIISAFGMPEYTDKVGVVKSIDYLGQLHGTWGKWQLVPGEDIYEIIGGNDEKRLL